MYKALVHFEDILDGRYVYNVGDEFPRHGYTPSKERIAALSSVNNKRKQQIIKFVDEEKDDVPIMNTPVEDSVEDFVEPVKSKRGRKRRGE